MPNINNESTVEAIARAFTSNGRNEEQGLISAGYSKAYARGGTSNKLYSNVLVKQAIARIDAKQGREQGRTVLNLDEMYQAIYDQAKGLKQPSAAVSAVTGLARLYGMDKDNQVHEDAPQALTPAELTLARDIAGEVISLHLSKEAV